MLCTLSGSLGCCPLSPKRLFQKRMVGFLWCSLVASTSCSLSSRALRFGDDCSFDGQSCPLRLTAFRALNGKDSASFQLLQLKRVCMSQHAHDVLLQLSWALPSSPVNCAGVWMVGFLWCSLVASTSCSLSSRALRFGDDCSFDGQSCPLRLTAFRALNGKDSASFQLLQLKRVCIYIYIYILYYV